MTKLETVRALSDSGPQLQIVESIRILQESVSLMHEELKRLPIAISTETAQTLEPLARLRQDMTGLKTSLDRMEQTTQQMATLPGKLVGSQQSMTKVADQLTEAANKVRPSLWRQTLGLILAGVVGAMLVATGQVGLNRLVPPSDVQEAADWANEIWSKATPKERELLKQIVNRPAS